MVAVAGTHLIDYGVYHLGYGILNANLATSWSHALDAWALAAGAIVCVAGAWRHLHRRAGWWATATMLALFFVDEISGLHTAIGGLYLGKLLYAPVLVLLAFSVWRLTRDCAYTGVVLASAALLVVSYVIHVIDPHRIARALDWRVGGWAFQVVVALKEGAELAGVLLALMALCGAAATANRAGGRRTSGEQQQAAQRTRKFARGQIVQ